MTDDQTVAQYTAINEVLRPRVAENSEATVHIDAGAAYGLGVKTMKELDWVSVGGEIDEARVRKGKSLYGDDLELAVSDVRKESFWKGFHVMQACDLLTCLGGLLDGLKDDQELDTVLGYMAKSARWGVFEVRKDDTQFWIRKLSDLGEVNYGAMRQLDAKGYNLIVVQFNEPSGGEDNE